MGAGYGRRQASSVMRQALGGGWRVRMKFGIGYVMRDNVMRDA